MKQLAKNKGFTNSNFVQIVCADKMNQSFKNANNEICTQDDLFASREKSESIY